MKTSVTEEVKTEGHEAVSSSVKISKESSEVISSEKSEKMSTEKVTTEKSATEKLIELESESDERPRFIKTIRGANIERKYKFL